MTVPAISPLAAVSGPVQANPVGSSGPAIDLGQVSFAQMLEKGIVATETKIVEADRLVARFAVDDSIPLHQVTYALEEARLSFELMLQVRNRLLEGTQQLLNMQL